MTTGPGATVTTGQSLNLVMSNMARYWQQNSDYFIRALMGRHQGLRGETVYLM